MSAFRGHPFAHSLTGALVALLALLAPLTPVSSGLTTSSALLPTTAQAQEAEGKGGVTFVGRVEGTDAFVAVVTDGFAVIAYVCDGESRGVAEDFVGSLGQAADGALWLTGDEGSILQLNLDEASLSEVIGTGGVLTGQLLSPDGAVSFPFAAEVAAEPAGLYRAEGEHRLDGTVGDAWWIVLNTGEVRGNALGRPVPPTPPCPNPAACGNAAAPPAAQPRTIIIRGTTAGDLLGGPTVMVATQTRTPPFTMTPLVSAITTGGRGVPCAGAIGVACSIQGQGLTGTWTKTGSGTFSITATIPAGVTDRIAVFLATTNGSEGPFAPGQ